MLWRECEEEEERTAAAEAVEAREPGVFRLGGGGRGETGMPPPNANTHAHIHDQNKTNTAESHAIKHAHQQDTCRQSHTSGGDCVWVGGWGGEVRWSMIRGSSYQTQ